MLKFYLKSKYVSKKTDGTYCQQEGVTGLAVRCKDEQYYTVREVAEIKGIKRQSILEGCRRGQYPGAYKTDADAINRQGVWLIPRTAIDSAVMTKDVVMVTKTLTATDLQTMIEKAVDGRMRQFEQRLENHDRLLTETLRVIQEKNDKKKKYWFEFWK